MSYLRSWLPALAGSLLLAEASPGQTAVQSTVSTTPVAAEIQREAIDVRASYIAVGDRFRRTGVPSTIQSEADRENVLVTLRPTDRFTLGIGRQHFRQDSTLPGVPDRATLHQVFGAADLLGRASRLASSTRGRREHETSAHTSAAREI